MRKIFSSKRKNKNPQESSPQEIKSQESKVKLKLFDFITQEQFKKVLYASLIVVGVVLATVALRIVIGELVEDAEARTEYQELRERYWQASEPRDGVEGLDEELGDEEEAERDLSDLSLDELAAINRDFIGWINASSTIDYPVVRGADNEKYINTTFFGSTNSAGTIFMDYRHLNGFDEQVSILYGHNTRDGSMFAALVNYLNPTYLRNNPTITITTRDGRKLTYRVFDARLTDAWDTAYTIGIADAGRASEMFSNVPANASRFLLLSTCTRSNNNDERILVFAAIT